MIDYVWQTHADQKLYIYRVKYRVFSKKDARNSFNGHPNIDLFPAPKKHR
jgi:hypothetical protein